jgi:hypothetical protein
MICGLFKMVFNNLVELKDRKQSKMSEGFAFINHCIETNSRLQFVSVLVLFQKRYSFNKRSSTKKPMPSISFFVF